MSLYIINSEYDLDNTLKECVKLIAIGNESKVRVAFKNMGMVQIFLSNLSSVCDTLNIDPEASEFSLDVFVGDGVDDYHGEDDEGEELEFDGSY
tara:strand:- start:285 stop:566 length:282 start_codon:yes stop_codon:yes gene_type:complete